MKLLLADDRKDWTLPTIEMLEMAGHVVTEENRGRRVIAKVQELQPEALILDIFFDQTDKVDAFNEILVPLRQDSLLSSLPIIVMSAQDRKRSAVAPSLFTEQGKTFWLPKELDHLLLVVLEHLEKSGDFLNLDLEELILRE